MLVKSYKESIDSHPIVKRLAQYRHMMLKLKSEQEDVYDYVKKLINSSKLESELNLIKLKLKKPKSNKIINRSKSNKSESKMDVDLVNDESNDNVNQESDLLTEKRAVTYKIAKNKGLTFKKRAELRNPRVKHRNKYRKALIRRKGAVSIMPVICIY